MSQIENFGTFSFFIIPYRNILSYSQLRHASLVGAELTHLSPPCRHTESLLYTFFVRFFFNLELLQTIGQGENPKY